MKFIVKGVSELAKLSPYFYNCIGEIRQDVYGRENREPIADAIERSHSAMDNDECRAYYEMMVAKLNDLIAGGVKDITFQPVMKQYELIYKFVEWVLNQPGCSLQDDVYIASYHNEVAEIIMILQDGDVDKAVRRIVELIYPMVVPGGSVIDDTITETIVTVLETYLALTNSSVIDETVTTEVRTPNGLATMVYNNAKRSNDVMVLSERISHTSTISGIRYSASNKTDSNGNGYVSLSGTSISGDVLNLNECTRNNEYAVFDYSTSTTTYEDIVYHQASISGESLVMYSDSSIEYGVNIDYIYTYYQGVLVIQGAGLSSESIYSSNASKYEDTRTETITTIYEGVLVKSGASLSGEIYAASDLSIEEEEILIEIIELGDTMIIPSASFSEPYLILDPSQTTMDETTFPVYHISLDGDVAILTGAELDKETTIKTETIYKPSKEDFICTFVPPNRGEG